MSIFGWVLDWSVSGVNKVTDDFGQIDRSPNRLYIIGNVDFCCPQDLPAKAFRILFLLDTLSATWLLCLLNDSEVSRWIPKIFGHWTSGRYESSMSIFGWVLDWSVSGVNKLPTTLVQRTIGSFSSGTQLSPLDSCLGYPPAPKT